MRSWPLLLLVALALSGCQHHGLSDRSNAFPLPMEAVKNGED